MEMRTLGGLTVSAVGVGCNNFGGRADEATSTAVIQAALDAGITFFDTADSYASTESEKILGKVLKPHRDEVIIATKFATKIGGDDTGGASPRWIRQAVEGSLQRLDTDVIDLYQQHWFDADVPLDETLGALGELVDAGKIRAYGCSNFTGTQIDDAVKAAEARGVAPFVSVQNELSLLKQEPVTDSIPACDRHGMGFLPYFPLGAGMLTGKYKRNEEKPAGARLTVAGDAPYYSSYTSDQAYDKVERLEKWAADRGHTILELAFAWLLAFEEIPSVIAGATKPEQIKANAAAAAWKLTPAERDEVAALAR
jgi:aryl-alcohol dehydrogenase-like predicted oxidoreductase